MTVRRLISALGSARRLASMCSFVGGIALTTLSVFGAGPFAASSIAGGVLASSAPSFAPIVRATVLPSPAVVATREPTETAPWTPAPTASPAPATTPVPIASAVPSPSLAAATLWFEDTFSSAQGAFWTGRGDYASAAYVDDRYAVSGKPVDLPVVLNAAAGEGTPGPMVVVEATVRLVAGPDDTEFGLAIRDSEDTRGLELLITPGGSYALYRDDVEVFESVAAGRRADLDGSREHLLRLEIEPAGTRVVIDGVLVGQSDATIVPATFGVAIWARSAAARVVVDDYRVWQLGD